MAVTPPATPVAAAAVKTNPVDVKVKRVRVAADADTSVQRHLDSTSDTVDGTLAWINSTFQVAPAPAKVAAPAGATPTIAAANTAKGLVTRAGATVNGPLASTGPVSGTAGSFTGPVSAPSAAIAGPLTATAGTFSGAVSGTTASFPGSSFRYCVGPFPYANGSYGGGIAIAAISYGTLTMGSQVMGFSVPFNGSIVAITGRVQSNTATTFQPYYYRNNASPVLLSNGSLAANAYTAWGQTYAKGSMPVNVGDFLGLGCGFGNASINVQFTGWFMIEAAP